MVISEYIFIISIVVLGLYYMLTLVQLVTFFTIKKTKTTLSSYPFVSVLVAARDEEENIERCLRALSLQDYPLDQLEVIVGDDASSDNTINVIEAFKQKNPLLNIVVIPIVDQLKDLHGKTNVLAHLFHKAKGGVVLITDADIAVSVSWVKGMLNQILEKGNDAVSGSTFVEANSMFGTFQAMEWIEAFGLLHAADYYKLEVTAVGNNMALTKKSYDATGGYEAIPFSVTEDLQLYLALREKGYKHQQVLNAEVIAWTKPIDSFLTLLKQRKRWLKGVKRTPLICQLFMAIHATLAIFIIGVMLYNVQWGMALYIFSVFIHVLRVTLISNRVKVAFEMQWLWYLFVIDLYQLVCSVSILVYYVLPVGVEWKKRVY